jgi:DNA-binding MarR family transcriptional regulator
VATTWPNDDTAWSDPGPDGANLKVNEFLTFHLLRLASIAKSNISREYLEPAGLSGPEWRVLATVVNFSPVPFSDITSMTTMDKGQVSRTLRSVQAKGYVITELVPIDRKPGDNTSSTASSSISRVVVSITDAGTDIYQKVMPLAQRYQAGLIGIMTADERRVMLDVLQRMYRHMAPGGKRG